MRYRHIALDVWCIPFHIYLPRTCNNTEQSNIICASCKAKTHFDKPSENTEMLRHNAIKKPTQFETCCIYKCLAIANWINF